MIQIPGNKKARSHGPAGAAPVPLGLASLADRLFLSFLFHLQRTLKQGRGCGLGIAAAAIGLYRLLGHELPQENSDCCRSAVSLRCPFPLTGAGACLFPLAV